MDVMEADILKERYDLAAQRLKELSEELSEGDDRYLPVGINDFFVMALHYLRILFEKQHCAQESCSEEMARERKLRAGAFCEGECREGRCRKGYNKPDSTSSVLWEVHDRLLAWLYGELHSLEAFVQADCKWDIVIRLELFLEIYAAYSYEWQENGSVAEYETIGRIIYWFAFDYADIAATLYVEELVSEDHSQRGVYLNSDSILYDFLPRVGRCPQGCPELGLDKAYVSRKLEGFKTALEKQGVKGLFMEEYCRQAKKYVAHLAQV